MPRTAVLVTTVPLGALIALGGAPPAATFPLLLAAVAAFFLCRASLFSRDYRWLDIALVLFLIGILAQFIPLPPDIVRILSPSTTRVQQILQLATSRTWPTLSIDEPSTRQGLASAAAAILVFWAARAAFSEGGVRAGSRLIAIVGAAMSLIALIARATAPTLLLWTWPIPGAQPYGPFVNRDHFAAWLLMGSAIGAGYSVAHIRSHQADASRDRRLVLHDVMADGTVMLLAACTATMLVALFASGSRGALAGLAVATLTAVAMSRQAGASHRSLLKGGLVLAVMFAIALWVNIDVIAPRLLPGTEVSRATIWRETWPIVRDFPLAGTGLGTFQWAMMPYQQSASERLFNQAHNEYLQLLAEGGLLLTVPAVAALVAWLTLAVRRLRDDRRDVVAVRIAAFAGMAGVALQCFWDSTLRMPANAMLLAWLAAVVIHQGRRMATPRTPRHSHRR